MDTLKSLSRLGGGGFVFRSAGVWAVCALLSGAGAAYAQPKPVQAVRAAAERAAQSSAKKAPAVLSPGARRMHELRESGFFNKIEPTAQNKLKVRFPETRELQRRALMVRYYRVMDDFAAFKKELDVKLFYQTLPGEARRFAPLEKNDLFTRMGNLSARVGALEAGAFRQDRGLRAARNYLAEAAGRVDPMFVGVFGQKGRVRADRKLDVNEFFLKNPRRSWFHSGETRGEWVFMGVRRSQKTAAKLPVKRIAVLNDQTEPILTFKDWHARGGFGDNIELNVYQDVDRLLRDARNGAEFDVIITDIMVPGGGGAYLVSELRDRNVNVPVIAFSQYDETPGLAKRLFEAGFDGMIHADAYFGSFNGDMLSFMNKLDYYFYYRDLHHWAR